MSKFLKLIPGFLLILGEVLSLVAVPQSFAHAQTAAYAEIAAIDVQKFPQISALVDVYDPSGQFISGLRPSDLTVYEDGQQLRDFVHVGDVARANLLAFEDPRADYQALNVGGGQAVTVLAFAECVAERAGTDSRPRVTQEYRFGDTRHILSDISRLRALGWQPAGHIGSSADEYLAWARSQPSFRNYADEARAHMREVGTVRSE